VSVDGKEVASRVCEILGEFLRRVEVAVREYDFRKRTEKALGESCFFLGSLIDLFQFYGNKRGVKAADDVSDGLAELDVLHRYARLVMEEGRTVVLRDWRGVLSRVGLKELDGRTLAGEEDVAVLVEPMKRYVELVRRDLVRLKEEIRKLSSVWGCLVNKEDVKKVDGLVDDVCRRILETGGVFAERYVEDGRVIYGTLLYDFGVEEAVDVTRDGWIEIERYVPWMRRVDFDAYRKLCSDVEIYCGDEEEEEGGLRYKCKVKDVNDVRKLNIIDELFGSVSRVIEDVTSRENVAGSVLLVDMHTKVYDYVEGRWR